MPRAAIGPARGIAHRGRRSGTTTLHQQDRLCAVVPAVTPRFLGEPGVYALLAGDPGSFPQEDGTPGTPVSGQFTGQDQVFPRLTGEPSAGALSSLGEDMTYPRIEADIGIPSPALDGSPRPPTPLYTVSQTSGSVPRITGLTGVYPRIAAIPDTEGCPCCT